MYCETGNFWFDDQSTIFGEFGRYTRVIDGPRGFFGGGEGGWWKLLRCWAGGNLGSFTTEQIKNQSAEGEMRDFILGFFTNKGIVNCDSFFTIWTRKFNKHRWNQWKSKNRGKEARSNSNSSFSQKTLICKTNKNSGKEVMRTGKIRLETPSQPLKTAIFTLSIFVWETTRLRFFCTWRRLFGEFPNSQKSAFSPAVPPLFLFILRLNTATHRSPLFHVISVVELRK